MADVVEYVIVCETALRRLVRTHLAGGVVMIPTRHVFDVFSALTVRITAVHRSLDLDSVVAVPRLLDAGRPHVGVHLNVDRAQWAGLEWLLNALVRERLAARDRGDELLRDRIETGEFLAIDDDGNAAIQARFSGSYPSVDADLQPPRAGVSRRRRLLVSTPTEPWAEADTQPLDGVDDVGEHAAVADSALRLLVADRPDEARAVLAAALEHAPDDAELRACWALLSQRAHSPS